MGSLLQQVDEKGIYLGKSQNAEDMKCFAVTICSAVQLAKPFCSGTHVSKFGCSFTLTIHKNITLFIQYIGDLNKTCNNEHKQILQILKV